MGDTHPGLRTFREKWRSRQRILVVILALLGVTTTGAVVAALGGHGITAWLGALVLLETVALIILTTSSERSVRTLVAEIEDLGPQDLEQQAAEVDPRWRAVGRILRELSVLQPSDLVVARIVRETGERLEELRGQPGQEAATQAVIQALRGVHLAMCAHRYEVESPIEFEFARENLQRKLTPFAGLFDPFG